MKNDGEEDKDELADLTFLENFRRDRAVSQAAATNTGLNRSSRTIQRKRRRLLADPNHTKESILISSSPSPEPNYEGPASDDMGSRDGAGETCDTAHVAEAESDSELEENAPFGSHHHPFSTRSSKFRALAPVALPMPKSQARPQFKLPPAAVRGIGDGVTDSILPATFSPSRRRGRKDYIPGGAADTLRNWIFGLAVQETEIDQPYRRQIRVSRLGPSSRNSRFTFVEDEDENKWILVGGRTRAGGVTAHTAGRKVELGNLIEVRGITSQIGVPRIREDGLDQGDGEGSHRAAEDEYTISISWDIIE